MAEHAWTAASLSALAVDCAAHDVLDQVTVVKPEDGGALQMTSLRQQFEEFVTASRDDFASVHAHMASHMKQLYRIIAPTRVSGDGAPARPPPLLHYPFGGVDVVTALGLLDGCAAGGCAVFAGAEVFADGGAQGLSRDLGALVRGSRYVRKGAGPTLFDSHDDFERLHDEVSNGVLHKDLVS